MYLKSSAITGLVGDGVTDDTVALQAILTAAGVGGRTVLPGGDIRYAVSQTLILPRDAELYGESNIGTTLVRTGDYGDTIKCGTGAYPNSAGSAVVENLFFAHGTDYTPGDIALDHKASGGSAHVRVLGGQNARVRNNTFWRMPYGVVMDHCDLSIVADNWCKGIWDPKNAGAQEGIAHLHLTGCQIMKVRGNYMTGAPSAPRSVTWTASDGALTHTATENVGPQFGIQMGSCEDYDIHDNFIGGQSNSSIYHLLDNQWITMSGRIHDNLFDSASHAAIYFSTTDVTKTSQLITITGNVFNGQLVGKYGIVAYNPLGAQHVLTDFVIEGNSFYAFVGTPIFMTHARGGRIGGNIFNRYNALGVSAGADPNFAAAGYFDAPSKFISIGDNVVGGQGVYDTNCKKGFVIAGAGLPGVVLNDNINAGCASFADQHIAGWGPPTGPLSRASFATATVTLPELAKRVAQMELDLTTKGIIGT